MAAHKKPQNQQKHVDQLMEVLSHFYDLAEFKSVGCAVQLVGLEARYSMMFILSNGVSERRQADVKKILERELSGISFSPIWYLQLEGQDEPIHSSSSRGGGLATA